MAKNNKKRHLFSLTRALRTPSGRWQIFLLAAVFFIVVLVSEQALSGFLSPQEEYLNLQLYQHRQLRNKITGDGEETDKRQYLDHSAAFVDAKFHSGLWRDQLGFDLRAYATTDIHQDAGAFHERTFWLVNNPYDLKPQEGCLDVWQSCSGGGVSIATTAIKWQFTEQSLVRVGYLRPSVPSAIGIDWSFLTGRYRGFEWGQYFEYGRLGVLWADRYKAPWFKQEYNFRNLNKAGEVVDSGQIYSFGWQQNVNDSTELEVAYAALTKDQRRNYHLKVKLQNNEVQFYFINDPDYYAHLAYQITTKTRWHAGIYAWQLESLYSYAPSTDPAVTRSFAYRLTQQYAGENGAYDVWWNTSGEFNHHQELAAFIQVARPLDSLLWPKLTVTVAAAAGQGSKAKGYKDLKEYAVSADLRQGFTFRQHSGHLTLHMIHYVNHSDAPSWQVYDNMFQDETGIKLTLSVHF